VIVQDLSNNKRRLAVFDSNLNRIKLDPEVDERYGAMNGFYNEYAFIGCNLINRSQSPSPLIIGNLEDTSLRDKVMGLNYGSGYIFLDETYDLNTNKTSIDYIAITGIYPITTANPFSVSISGGPYRVEAAFIQEGNLYVFLNSQVTNVIILTGLAPNYFFNRSFSSGSFHYIPENRFAAQTLNGKWEIYYYYNNNYEQDLYARLKIDPGYLFAFGKEEYVYLFNSTSRQLFKCRGVIKLINYD